MQMCDLDYHINLSRMKRKAIAMIGVIGFLAAAGVAFAETDSIGSAVESIRPQPMVLEVGPGGKVLMRGTVGSVSTTSLTVKSWGGDWTVNVLTAAEVLPEGHRIPDFKVGDFVGVHGSVNQRANWTIDARIVRNWTVRKALREEIKQNTELVREEMESGTPRNFEGIISGIDASARTFMLAGEEKTYSVILTTDAIILKKNRATLDFSKVQDGDRVRVWGSVASSTITASVFRDISL